MRIGVCIPTYKNHLPFLERCLDSIQDQTVQPSIVSISASSITEPLVLKPRPFPVKLLVTPNQQFAAENRNKAATEILDETDILSFIDGDDEMLPCRLEYVLRAFEETKADFVLHSFVDLKAPYETKPTPESKYSTYRCLKNPFTVNTAMYAGLELPPVENIAGQDSLPPIHNGHLSLLSPIFRTHQYGDFIVTLPNKSYGWEDTEFNRRLYLNGYTGAFIPCQLSLYHSYPK
jgi:glycosyltransferase involved in cell wall biosynthesis